MTTESLAGTPPPPTRNLDRRKRAILGTGIAFMVVAGLLLQNAYLPKIKGALEGTEVLVTDSPTDEPWHILPGRVRASPLDSPFIELELPRDKTEFLSLTPPATHALWRDALLVDYLLIVGYVFFFFSVSLGTRDKPTLWEQIGFCGLMAGIADCIENLTTGMLIGNTVQDLRLGEAATWISMLTVFGALKWLLFFLACRAICIELEDWVDWRWIAVWLRATSTVGSWAALFALVGLPSRSILTLMVYASSLLIAVVAAKRLRGDPPGERVPEKRKEALADAHAAI